MLKYAGRINEAGRNDLFNYYGAGDAAASSSAWAPSAMSPEEVIDYLTAKGREGRPGSGPPVCRPGSQRPAEGPARDRQKIAVLDAEARLLGDQPCTWMSPCVGQRRTSVLTGGCYGLGSRTPAYSVFLLSHRALEKDARSRFTIGITDDVTSLSLPESQARSHHLRPGTKVQVHQGLGGDRHCRCQQELHQDHRRPY